VNADAQAGIFFGSLHRLSEGRAIGDHGRARENAVLIGLDNALRQTF
jgi:hypothetical protein